MIDPPTFDPVWEEKYAGGHAQRYPWDLVVSFVYRHRPAGRKNGDIRILEVGCGTGANLWFAAREGFSVSGIDASQSAIRYARQRFQGEGLEGDLRVGDFTRMPFASGTFDLVIDRAAITCCGFSAGKKAVEEVRRVLADEGKFLFNAYSRRHLSAVSGKPGGDGLITGIRCGKLVGFGQLCFYGKADITSLFKNGWRLLSMEHLELVDELDPERAVHAEWRVIAGKA